MDEVGRGCFAGPVVAACVAFPKNQPLDNIFLGTAEKQIDKNSRIVINDSKLLSVKQREKALIWIKENALTWGIGIGSVGRINRKGIVNAANFAFRSALKQAQNRLNRNIEYLLIDAFYIPYTKGFHIPSKRKRKIHDSNESIVNQLAIIKGDTKSISIAAASIIAKVYRDNLMSRLGEKSCYKKYHWEKNKGYGTKDHREAILKFGVSKLHRKQYVSTFLKGVVQ
jgi:ribonuclease HII